MRLSRLKNRIAKEAHLRVLDERYNHDTGHAIPSGFDRVNTLFDRARRMKWVNRRIAKCRKCDDLNVVGATESAPGYGDLSSPIVFIGQSLCTACMATQIPFTKGSGYYIDLALSCSELTRRDVYITNIVKCHPPKNRRSKSSEMRNCVEYLREELIIIDPLLIVALGNDAANACNRFNLIPSGCSFHKAMHPASFLYGNTTGVFSWIVNLSLELDKHVKRYIDGCEQSDRMLFE